MITLAYLRRNRFQAELAQAYSVSQSKISRAASGTTPLLHAVLSEFVPTADDLDRATQYIVDGTLLPCCSWAGHRELYSGKHKTTGLSVRVACRLDGTPAWISDTINGARHDTSALKHSEVLVTTDPSLRIGDKDDYSGRGRSGRPSAAICGDLQLKVGPE
ncbi:transposase family protein [Winogradskya humida]|uniref:DDE Tnp4 domain-containing protein n=1 Tax=Winogradskya humida TaxID=113566 RepID=A0ABQ3ZFT4_9ACTN|nr:transposase family protein [Actinoplanes humidus]GIE17363.1 hypothetical protein Ahu01nite_004650 [Actinoplanes humidus]